MVLIPSDTNVRQSEALNVSDRTKPTGRLSARASPLACAPTIPPSARQVNLVTR